MYLPAVANQTGSVQAAAIDATQTIITKYYYFGTQRVAMAKGGEFRYLHGDHLGSTVMETNLSGAVITDQTYYAFGSQRDSGPVTTDHKFTGQKLDGSGLMYYNARYYDPTIGQFVSPDTLVPDPLNVMAYNRYMYAMGNPLKFIDPSGHYSDEALYNHFDCDSWDCVESQFEEGGQHAGRWGWLKVLMTAEDGDMIDSHYVDSTGIRQYFSGQFTTVDGLIMIQPQGEDGLPASEVTGAVIGTLGINGGYHLSGANGSVSITYSEKHLDCRHTDCTQRALNAGATASATVAVACASSVVGNAGCTQAALGASTIFGVAGMVRTGYKVILGDSSALDVAVAWQLLKIGASSNPFVSVTSNSAQWAWDEFVSPNIPQGW